MGKAEAAGERDEQQPEKATTSGAIDELVRIPCARCGSEQVIHPEVARELGKLNAELKRRGEELITRALAKHCDACKAALLAAVQRSRTRQFTLRLEAVDVADEEHFFALWRSGQISKDELPPRLRVTRWAQIRAIEEAREVVRAREIQRVAEESRRRDRVPGEDDGGEPVERCEHGYRLDAICFACERVD